MRRAKIFSKNSKSKIHKLALLPLRNLGLVRFDIIRVTNVFLNR
jgi:hypothetical protein